MAGEATAGSGQRTGRNDARIRHDPTGEITRSLDELIKEGDAITLELQALTGEHAVNGPTKTIEHWRVACLHMLHAAFEREAPLEFLRASNPTTRPDEHTATAGAHIQRMQDALALLYALKGTLKRPGPLSAYRNAGELCGFPSQAPGALPTEKLVPSQH